VGNKFSSTFATFEKDVNRWNFHLGEIGKRKGARQVA
jgi:hypothetical protein